MDQEMSCLICKKELFSEITENYCKLCGMALGGDSLFCCDSCEDKFGMILTGDFK